MDFLAEIPASAVVIGAFAMQALGFLVRDELWLRGLLLLGTVLYVLYYLIAPGGPLWAAMMGSCILGAINLALIVVILRERTRFTMTHEEAALYGAFQPLTPGQFRRIMRAAELVEAEEPRSLTMENEAVTHLVFLIDGTVSITKGAETSPIVPRAFIGEIAFLLDRPASATVMAAGDARYLRWPFEDLKALMRKSPALHNAMLARFNAELADKLGRARPDPGVTLPTMRP